MLYLLKMLAERLFWPIFIVSDTGDTIDDEESISLFLGMFALLGLIIFGVILVLWIFHPDHLRTPIVLIPYSLLIALGYLGDWISKRTFGFDMFKFKLNS